jgi:maltose alpha-D-glucosyltransferase/alpha-amylase
LARQAMAWEQQTAQAFLEGYRNGIVACPTWPADDQAVAQLMRLFLIEKALYEIRYELDNRPDWVGVPVGGLLRYLENR